MQTELNKGTIFFIDIPFEKALVSTLYEDESPNFEEITTVTKEIQEHKPTEAIKPELTATEESKLHVLLIEDDLLARKIATILLESLHCTVTTAIDVKNALEVLNQAKFDVVISDIGLPDGTGIDVIYTIKRNQSAPNFSTPFIALTANIDAKTISESEQAGFIEVMAKPMQTEIVQSIFAKFVSNRSDPHPKNL